MITPRSWCILFFPRKCSYFQYFRLSEKNNSACTHSTVKNSLSYARHTLYQNSFQNRIFCSRVSINSTFPPFVVHLVRTPRSSCIPFPPVIVWILPENPIFLEEYLVFGCNFLLFNIFNDALRPILIEAKIHEKRNVTFAWELFLSPSYPSKNTIQNCLLFPDPHRGKIGQMLSLLLPLSRAQQVCRSR